MSTEEKIEITKKELKELIDKRVEDKLEKKTEKSSSDRENTVQASKKGISRRGFLKKLGFGVAGLGVLSLPVSGLNIRDSSGLSVFSGGTNFLDVSGDPVEVVNADMSIRGNTVLHGGNLSSFDVSGFSGGGGSAGQFLKTDGSSLSWDTVSTFSGSHSDLSNVSAGDHHPEPSGSGNVNVDSNNNISLNQGSGSGLDADTVDGTEASDLGGNYRQGWTSNTLFSTTTNDSYTEIITTGPATTDKQYRKWVVRFYQDFNTDANFQGYIKKNGNTLDSVSSVTGTFTKNLGLYPTTFYKGSARVSSSDELTPGDTITVEFTNTHQFIVNAYGKIYD